MTWKWGLGKDERAGTKPEALRPGAPRELKTPRSS
jgi:hypothetical protein